jgi:DNA-binding CsgD family transcriptional regulator
MLRVRGADVEHPVFATDRDLRIVEWAGAIEQFTGVTREDAIGRRCWDVIAARDLHARPVCRAGCPVGRLARAGWELRRSDLSVALPSGRTAIGLACTRAPTSGGPVIRHEVSNASASSGPGATPGVHGLTARQREILELLDSGLRVAAIAELLVLSEATVRNHVHAVLVALDVHSQLEAVALARQLGLVGDPRP